MTRWPDHPMARSPDGPIPLLAARHQIQRFLHRAAFGHDFLLQQRDRINHLLGTRRTPGDIDIHGNDLIHALHQRVIIEDATGSRAGPHRDDPLRFRHLLPELANYGSHFVRDAAGNDHQVRLPRRRPEHFGAKARDIETLRTHRHHFNRAAGQAKCHRPDRTLARPVDGRVKRGHDDTFGDAVPEDEFLDYLLAVFDINVWTETELLRHGYILTAETPSAQRKRRVGGAQPGRPLLLASGTNCAPNCSFRRLRIAPRRSNFLDKVVLAGLIDHANVVELCRSLIGNRLVDLSQLKRRGIALVFHTDDKSRLSSLHWISKMSLDLNSSPSSASSASRR